MKKILTAGIYFLDTIVVRDYPEGPQKQRTFNETIALEEVGGTCGNVATILSWLGQDVYPIAHFDESAEGHKLSADLAHYGCDCRFVRNDSDGGTSTLRCTHKLNPDGSHKVTFRAGSPGSRFPKHRFLRARDEAPEFINQLDFKPDVFFFDDPAAGHRVLAKALRAKGTLIYFEPARVESNADMDSIAASDIIKFSGENIPDTSFIEQFDNKLFIQTMGADGIRFKLGEADWVKLPPVLNDNFVDYEGAGDWTTSAFINYLCKKGVLSVAQMDIQLVREALEEAQVYASKSVSYLGSKGMIHDIEKQ